MKVICKSYHHAKRQKIVSISQLQMPCFDSKLMSSAEDV